MAEFTGERVIPGQVDENLLNEHVSRYRFAARFAAGARVLDAGCGTGYGAAALVTAASVIAFDVSAEAILHASQNFSRPRLTFLQASCDALPFAPAHFDLVTAFEVIEHLDHWRELLEEASRVLKSTGVLLVSTPNKSYYAETRGAAGPNPFHCHEFEFAEFEAALNAVFPHVRLWTQNHSQAIVFAPQDPAATALEAGGDTSPRNAHFFVAACSHSPIALNDVFAWVPASGNLLREREHHIEKLEAECARKDAWLKELIAAHDSLHTAHNATLAELKQRNEWATHLDAEIAQAREAIKHAEEQAATRLEWVESLHAQLAKAEAEILRLNQVYAEHNAELVARTEWAQTMHQQLQERTAHVLIQTDEIAALKARLADLTAIGKTTWYRLGRKLGRVPPLSAGNE